MKIEIIGRMGAGKTTICKFLNTYYDAKILEEPVRTNPYLKGFYGGLDYSFIMQCYLMCYHFEQHKLKFDNPDFYKNYKHVVMDSTCHSNLIFARTMYQQGMMTGEEIDIIEQMYKVYMSKVQKSDLLVYIDCDDSKLIQNIANRGRDFEQKVDLQYLDVLGAEHVAWYNNYSGNKILIDTTMLDLFLRRDREIVLNRIMNQLLN